MEDITSKNQLKKFQILYDLATAMTTERSLDDNLQLVVEESRELLYRFAR